MQNSQENLLRWKHLAACTAQALLTLTSCCALNCINILQSMCPGEMLQLMTTLGSRHPSGWAHQVKPRAAAPGHVVPRLPPLSCFCPHLASHLGPLAAQGSSGGPWAPPMSYPSMLSPEIAVVACLTRLGRRVQQLLLLPGWLGGRSGTQKPRFSPCSCCG